MDREQIKKDLKELFWEGADIYFSSVKRYNKDAFKDSDEDTQDAVREAIAKIKYPKVDYNFWYHKACKAIRIFAPERLEEFEKLYTGDTTIKDPADLGIITAGTSHYIRDYFIFKDGKKEDFFDIFRSCFDMQRTILGVVFRSIDHVFYNLENDIHNSVYKSEIDIAKDIQDQGHLKIAGAVAGVIIEAHLKTLVANKNIPIKTQNNKPPTMDDYNTALKKDDAYDTATWRLIQRCGDIRNDCAHSNEDKPTKEETDDIIRAAEQIIMTYN